ncbi:T9SS type A sorting domain-containing protein [Prolixibacter sp. NT017]|uniref:T9SS type A sorting domain-containing protein n=1 Tax=Prolixibacter sp. NT017 TaxID=2652390 RepID=UPI00127DF9ED|nr:T9SS type A sorting domain-containing protein [Prolixibacter sp. NT017]GET27049.1 hypothetical protein NT017_33780 [Prolixibacter sp. NT017]
MPRRLTLLIVLAFFLILGNQAYSKNYNRSLPGRYALCYKSDSVRKSFVPPPNAFLKSATANSNFSLELIGFSQEAADAFRYAVSVWESVLDSPVPIRLKATWTSLDKGVLGSCGPASYYRDFNGALRENTYYPVALADKMSNQDILGSTSPDMVARFNSDNTDWYFGTDGNTPVDKYDFVSVVIHEIGHGLGIIGFASVTGLEGKIGDDTNLFPGIYDVYVQNLQGEQLVDTNYFANPSADLYSQFTGNALQFDSRLAREDYNGTNPRLYAPSTWNDGSSFYHLDDATYPAGSANALMTHALAYGEANHDPGPLLEGMLAEMGWKYTYIVHTPVSDYDQLPSEVPVTAKVYGDYGIDTSSVVLHYSFDNWQTEAVDTMLSTGNPDEYSASITVPAMGTTTDYYISVTDLRQRNFTKPEHAPSNYYSFYVGPDVTPPSLSHVPVKMVFSSADSVYIEATATDNIGVASVKVELMLNSSNAGTFDLSLVADSTYAANVPLPSGLTSNDVLEYRIVATDSSPNSNQSTLPAKNYYIVSIVSVLPAVTYYENDFNTATDDFSGTDFTVSKTSLFDNDALNSPHPYEGSGDKAPYINYITVLRSPVVLNANTEMAFDEVVLVEPGADNATFGSADFYDYVVVEGSKDDGHTWKAIAPGWDSSSSGTWLTAYNQDIQNGNSLTEGSKDMFKRRVLDMTSSSDFSPGDTILVRFRLYSDPYAWAWGWCIDNLLIGDNVDVATIPLSPGDLRLYPNPVHDQMQLELDLEKPADSGNIVVYNYLGQRMYNRQVYPVDGRLTEQLDFSAYPPGMYLVNIEVGGQQISRKVIKR